MRAVQRIFAIFESFTSEKSSLTLQEIADGIELSKSTAFRIVQSLEEAGYLVRLEDQKYCLSFRFIRLAGVVRSTLGIREIARPIMSKLADKTKETVSIHTHNERNRVCIDAIFTARSPLRSIVQPGEYAPLGLGSASKVLLAFMPESQAAPIVDGIARRTKLSKADLLAEVAMAKEQGYSVSHGGRLLGVSAVAAPIKDANDEVHYCLSIGGPTVRMQPNEKDIVRQVVRAAADISRQFGGRNS